MKPYCIVLDEIHTKKNALDFYVSFVLFSIGQLLFQTNALIIIYSSLWTRLELLRKGFVQKLEKPQLCWFWIWNVISKYSQCCCGLYDILPGQKANCFTSFSQACKSVEQEKKIERKCCNNSKFCIFFLA